MTKASYSSGATEPTGALTSSWEPAADLDEKGQPRAPRTPDRGNAHGGTGYPKSKQLKAPRTEDRGNAHGRVR